MRECGFDLLGSDGNDKQGDDEKRTAVNDNPAFADANKTVNVQMHVGRGCGRDGPGCRLLRNVFFARRIVDYGNGRRRRAERSRGSVTASSSGSTRSGTDTDDYVIKPGKRS